MTTTGKTLADMTRDNVFRNAQDIVKKLNVCAERIASEITYLQNHEPREGNNKPMTNFASDVVAEIRSLIGNLSALDSMVVNAFEADIARMDPK